MKLNATPSRVVPVLVILGLAIVAFYSFARGKRNQVLDGVFIRDNLLNEFYPGSRGCPVSGLPDWLVTNPEFEEGVAFRTSDLSDLRGLFHSAWHVKIKGDVSRLGSYGMNGRYWREVRVSDLIEAEPLPSCKQAD